jgi:hypothetical protein
MQTRTKAVILSFSFFIPLAASALERPDLCPPEARTYLRITNTTNLFSQLQKSPIGKLWKDPQFQDFLGHPDIDSWHELIFDADTEAESQIFTEQFKMLTGEVVLAFGDDMNNPFLIAAISKEDFARSLEMDDRLREMKTHAFDIVKDTFHDVEIIQHIDLPGTPKEESSWQAHLNGTLVMGNSREWIEQCIVRLKKEKIEEPTGDPWLHVNLPLSKLVRESLLEGMKKGAAKKRQPALYEPEALLEALGLMGIEGLSTTIALHDERAIVNTNLRVTDLTKGIFSILDVQPAELPTVTFIPDNISSLEVGRFNLLRLWQEIPNVLDTAMPAIKPQFDMVVAMLRQQTGIDLEQDLLAYLDTKYFSFATVEGDTQLSIVAVELKDGPAFKTGLESALAAPAIQPQVATGLKTEIFLEHTIYAVQNDDPGSPVAFGVVGDYLLYGHPEALRQVIRSQTSDAAANQSFERQPLVKGLRKHVPPQAFGYRAIDWEKYMAVIVREFSKPGTATLIQQNWARSGSPVPPPDFDKLPPADHIASFFNVTYQYVEAAGDGLHQRIILNY